MFEIKEGRTVLARHIKADDIKDGLNFYSNDDEYIQVGAWQYKENTELLAHIHQQVERKVDRTNEVLYIISGKIEADIYNLEEKLLKTITLLPGDILVLLECGHGYRIMENDTKVLEIKNGPYLGADVDRRRF